MSTESAAKVIDEIAIKGFIRQKLEIWYTDNYIKEMLMKECKDKRDDLKSRDFAIHFTSGKNRDKEACYIPSFELAFKISDEYKESNKKESNKDGPIDEALFCYNDMKYKGKENSRMFKNYYFTEEEAKQIFVENGDKFKEIKGFSSENDKKSLVIIGKGEFYIRCENGCLNIRNGKFYGELKNGTKAIPCCKMSLEEFYEGIEAGEFELVEGNVKKIKFHNEVINTILEFKDYIEIQPDAKGKYNSESIEQMLEKCEKRIERMRAFDPDKFSNKKMSDIFSEWLSKTPTLNELQTQIVLHTACMSDKYRCNLKPMSVTCMDEGNEGHWELFSNSDDDEKVKLCRRFSARDPREDIPFNSIVGIDFGTKSTVVSLADDENKEKLIRVGTSVYDVNTKTEDYENPTILEFFDKEKFLKAYKANIGRPYTLSDDIKSSHLAEENLKKEDRDLNTFITDIKQWCGDTTGSRIPTIKDHSGAPSENLPEFKNCRSNEFFNPLEIYAYYLGLSINNMYNKVYLNYNMSFPTTYEKDIRELMILSFERGLKKSLPDAILKDEELMKGFSVKASRSEPAAYAICAMKEYQLKPAPGEKILYSVFDFGGGTTDMVFGIWRKADHNNRKEIRYSYVIEQFNEEGDRYLGGENLLELMAYHVFAHNMRTICDNNQIFPFTKPPRIKSVPGAEKIVNNTPVARSNMLQLIKELRPFWEGIVDYDAEDTQDYNGIPNTDNHTDRILKGYKLNPDSSIEFVKTGYIDVKLKDTNNKEEKKRLYIDSMENAIFVDLIKILEGRIKDGIITYFQALKQALKDERANGINEVNLLLAGNSSKSPILDKLLRKHIAEFMQESDSQIEIKILPPLGTEQSYNAGAKSHDRPDKPTGKTGVAYGLIEQSVLVKEERDADEEAKFQFYIGLKDDEKFELKVDRNVPNGVWQPMRIPADTDMWLYYTDLADAKSGNLDIKKTKRTLCHNDKPDFDKDYYICTDKTDKIKYGIGEICSDDGTFDENTIEVIGEIILKP